MDNYTQRFHGTAARQLVLLTDAPPAPRPTRPAPPASRLRLLQKDVYAELARRRRHAQIAARRWVDETP
jgi:hypothetical protein